MAYTQRGFVGFIETLLILNHFIFICVCFCQKCIGLLFSSFSIHSRVFTVSVWTCKNVFRELILSAWNGHLLIWKCLHSTKINHLTLCLNHLEGHRQAVLRLRESQGSSKLFWQEILCETTATWKVTANHSYIPAGFFFFCHLCDLNQHSRGM